MKQELITLIIESQALHIFFYSCISDDAFPPLYTCIPVLQDKGIFCQLPLVIEKLSEQSFFSQKKQPLTAIALAPLIEVINSCENEPSSQQEQILHTRYSCLLDATISLWYHCAFSSLTLLQLQLMALKLPYRCIALTSFSGALIRYLTQKNPSFPWTVELNNQMPLMPQLQQWCHITNANRSLILSEGLRVLVSEEL